jgi:hypothetical protein
MNNVVMTKAFVKSSQVSMIAESGHMRTYTSCIAVQWYSSGIAMYVFV